MKDKDLDVIRRVGEWSRKKLEILQKYLHAYTAILHNQQKLDYYYIDAFAGPGVHKLKSDPERMIDGSPKLALGAVHPFDKYFFMELDPRRVEELKKLKGTREDVEIIQADCNKVLLEKLIPFLNSHWKNRAFCLLDPDGLNVKWPVIEKCGLSGKVDMLLNFSVMGMNLNATPRNQEEIKPEYCKNMNEQWGDESWRSVVYKKSEMGLFPDSDGPFAKASNNYIMQAFRKRLLEVGMFKFVSEPVPFFESKSNSPIYYLFFASQKKVATGIFDDIVKKMNRDGPDFWWMDMGKRNNDSTI